MPEKALSEDFNSVLCGAFALAKSIGGFLSELQAEISFDLCPAPRYPQYKPSVAPTQEDHA
jgi:hypothetical protein